MPKSKRRRSADARTTALAELLGTPVQRPNCLAEYLDCAGEAIRAAEYLTATDERAMDLPDRFCSTSSKNAQNHLTIAAAFIDPYPVEIQERTRRVIGQLHDKLTPIVQGEIIEFDTKQSRTRARIAEIARELQPLNDLVAELRGYDLQHGTPEPPAVLNVQRSATVSEIADDVVKAKTATDDWLTVKQAAIEAGTEKGTISRWCDKRPPLFESRGRGPGRLIEPVSFRAYLSKWKTKKRETDSWRE